MSTTEAPCATTIFAMASPMPDEPPVMTTDLPRRSSARGANNDESILSSTSAPSTTDAHTNTLDQEVEAAITSIGGVGRRIFLGISTLIVHC